MQGIKLLNLEDKNKIRDGTWCFRSVVDDVEIALSGFRSALSLLAGEDLEQVRIEKDKIHTMSEKLRLPRVCIQRNGQMSKAPSS